MEAPADVRKFLRLISAIDPRRRPTTVEPSAARTLLTTSCHTHRHHLLTVVFLASQSMNSSSVFRTYFDVLPNELDHALFYSPAAVRGIRGSRAHPAIQETMKLFQQEVGLIRSAAPSLFARIGMERLRWAFATMSSRAFQIDLVTGTRLYEREEDTVTDRVMAPVLDMFNHIPDAKSSIYHRKSDGMIILETSRGWRKGEEVFISVRRIALVMRVEFSLI